MNQIQWLIYIFIAMTVSRPSWAATKPANEKTQLVPDLTYRQAYITVRKSSPYYLTRYKNYADQLYLSLKMVKTFLYVNEITLEPVIRTVRNRPGDLETVIDQGYVRSYINNMDFTAGKKTEFSGSGFFLNPSDLLNEDKDQLDSLYQREGKYFTRFGITNDDLYFGLGYIPRQDFGNQNGSTNAEGKGGAAENGLLWLKSNLQLGAGELSLQYTFNKEQLSTLGVSGSRFFGDHFELHADGRYQQHQRAIEQQNERTVFDCTSVNTVDESKRTVPGDELYCLEPSFANDAPSYFAVVGSRAVITMKRTVVFEVIQNQSGLSTDERDMYSRYVRIQRDSGNETDPPTRINGRQYYFLGYQDEESIQDTSFNLGFLYNQIDRSNFFNTELRYSFTPFTNVSLLYLSLAGSKDSEFGEYPFASTIYLIFRGKF